MTSTQVVEVLDFRSIIGYSTHNVILQLDSALIDEMEWPRHTRDQGAACAAVATYGPAGSNATRALILRRGAADWGPTGRVSLDKLVKMYPELM